MSNSPATPPITPASLITWACPEAAPFGRDSADTFPPSQITGVAPTNGNPQKLPLEPTDGARVVDEGRERPERAVAFSEQAHDVGLLGDIAGHRDRPAAGVDDVPHDGLGRGAVAEIAQADRIAALRGEAGGGGADAAAAAGDDHHLHLPLMKRRSRSPIVS